MSEAKTLAFIQTWRKDMPQPKGKVSAVQMKQVAKSLEKIGKTVTNVKVQPDGSFQLTTADQVGQDAPAVSYWDKVLPK